MGKESSKPGKGLCVCQNADLQFLAMDFVGFLFGNVNSDGELEDENVLDKDSLAGLSRLGVGLGSDLGEMLGEVSSGGGDDYDASDEEEEEGEEPLTGAAEDFADITEVAEDASPSINTSPARPSTTGTTPPPLQPSLPPVTSDTPISSSATPTFSSATPPPPASELMVPPKSTHIPVHPSSDHLLDSPTKSAFTSAPRPSVPSLPPQMAPPSLLVTPPPFSVTPPSPSAPTTMETAPPTHTLTCSKTVKSPKEEEIESAIPSLIPENMTLEQLRAKVKTLFPGFKSQGILRFSSLLGPGKPSSLPRIWREARKPKRKPKSKKKSVDGTDEGLGCSWKLDLDFKPTPDMIASDDEEAFLSVSTSDSKGKLSGSSSVEGGIGFGDPLTREWRYGPAKIWYDALGVPEHGGGLDYGFKIKDPSDGDDLGSASPSSEDCVPDEAHFMVAQEHWEDRVLWDVPHSPGLTYSGVGGVWKAVSESSTAFSRQLSAGRSSLGTMGVAGSAMGSSSTTPTDEEPRQSMFPVDNYELVYGRWEDRIIWDTEAMTSIPSPTLPRIDPNDSNFIIGVPEEPAPAINTEKDTRKENKKPGRYSGVRGAKGPGSVARQGESGSSPHVSCFQAKKDPFNLSNDEYYNPKHISISQGLGGFDSNVVQHSTPALELYPPWFPTQPSSSALRYFHRPKLRIRCPTGENGTGWYTVSSVERHVTEKGLEREQEREASGGGEVFFMRTPKDLSSCDGEMVLAEYSEQYPPMLSAIGLATKIKNYYRRCERQVKSQSPDVPYGETTYIQNTSYFLGQLRPGQLLQSFENNLFRAPIYQHSLPDTDFVLVISGNEVYIRDSPQIFVVGQECPKLEVPAPNSKAATQFQRELLQVFLYQQFRKSEDSPRRLKMDVIRKAFPPSVISESVIRKVLKTCADFKREGYENGWWVLRDDFRLPTSEELRSLISPEQVCSYLSMLASEHRLKEAGYRGKSLFIVEEEEEEDSVSKMDDELRAAPWNTTHHFINASKGKYQLSVSGPADPTGCGEGFSYTRLNTKRETASSVAAAKRYKNVMGTDGDLRKLKLSKAKTLLRDFGVQEEEISRLSRWQVIDKVRELSTEAARSGDGVDLMNLKFARGARFSHTEAQERYREECQKMFDLQNSVLSSAEVLSTDEESSGEDDSDTELGRNLETLLRGKKTTAQLSQEQEEAERAELRRLLSDDRPSRTPDLTEAGTPMGLAADGDDASSIKSYSSIAGRHLIISRTFHDEDGHEFVRDEVVKRPDVINAYVQLSKEVRSKFVDQDQETREDMKKEKRKIQDQLRRLKKMEEKNKKKAQKPQKPKPLTTVKMKCSACGEKGHMKTNRNCPMYKNNPVNVAPTDLELAQAETEMPQDDLVKVEGTKVVVNRAVVEHAQDVRRKSLLLKFPKMKKRRRAPTEEDLDYLEKRKSIQRRKTSPEVPFGDHLEKILNILMNLPESFHFRKPVNSKLVPDYYNVIKFPMDLHTMKDHCRKLVYKSRDQFREHINLLVTNCITYNGSQSEVTKHARRMAEMCNEEMQKVETELEQLEAEINPALDDNALVAFNYVLSKVVTSMKEVPETWPFHHPVSAKKIPDYHKIIKTPMDLQSMHKKCSTHQYTSQEMYLADLNQIVENSITYNGPSSQYTQTAEKMREAGLRKIAEDANLLEKLEKRLNGTASPFPLLKLLEGSQPLEDESLLFEDLQHSSSSSDSASDSDMDQD